MHCRLAAGGDHAPSAQELVERPTPLFGCRSAAPHSVRRGSGWLRSAKERIKLVGVHVHDPGFGQLVIAEMADVTVLAILDRLSASLSLRVRQRYDVLVRGEDIVQLDAERAALEAIAERRAPSSTPPGTPMARAGSSRCGANSSRRRRCTDPV